MVKTKVPDKCPTCGAEGSLSIQGGEFVCKSPGCGRAFPINPDKGPGVKEDKPVSEPAV